MKGAEHSDSPMIRPTSDQIVGEELSGESRELTRSW